MVRNLEIPNPHPPQSIEFVIHLEASKKHPNMPKPHNIILLKMGTLQSLLLRISHAHKIMNFLTSI